MNNALLAMQNVALELETPVVNTTFLQSREAELVKIIESLEHLKSSRDWRVLNTLVFSHLVETITTLRNSEASKVNPDVQKLAQLNGQKLWADKYSDLEKMEVPFRVELENIRKQLQYGQSQKES